MEHTFSLVRILPTLQNAPLFIITSILSLASLRSSQLSLHPCLPAPYLRLCTSASHAGALTCSFLQNGSPDCFVCNGFQ